MRQLLFRVFRVPAVIAALAVVVFIIFPQLCSAQYAHWAKCDTGYHAAKGRFIPGGFLAGSDKTFMEPYFINPKIGFAFEWATGLSGSRDTEREHPRLFRTTDSAQTWTHCDTTQIVGGIEQMYFPTVAHGYLATLADTGPPDVNYGGIYETGDTGLSWRQISPTGYSYIGVWSAGSRVMAMTDSGELQTTTNDGFSWSIEKSPSGLYGWQGDLSFSGDGNNFVIANIYQEDTIQSILASTDGGASWKQYFDTTYVYFLPKLNGNGSYDDYYSLAYCVPGTSTIFWSDFFRRDSVILTDTLFIFRSSNLQARPDTSFVLVSPPNYFNDFSGSGCSVYDRISIGTLLRTTDLGNTWSLISCPPDAPSNGYANLCVTGTGADVYLIDDTGYYMWRTTDGGDGTMANYALYTISLTSQLPSSSHGDTLETTACDSTNFSFTFQYTGSCSSAVLDSAFISGLDTNEYQISRTSHTIGENVPDTGWITIRPGQSGIRTFMVHAQYIDDSKNIIDTSISLSIDVSANPGVLILNAMHPYDFGTQALCAPVRVNDTFSLAARGCQAVTVDSIIFRSDSAQFTDFTFTNITKSFIADSISRKFPISFKPSIADTERGSIFVYWTDGVNTYIDTIQAQGVGVTDTRTFAIRTDTLSVRMCDSTTGTITITNTTCGTLTLDSLALPNGVVLARGMNPAFPIVLASGASDTMIVDLALGRAGSTDLQVGDTTLSSVAFMQFTEHGSSSAFDTTLALNIHVGSGIPAASISTNSLNFGSVSTCGQSVTLPVVIASTGCDTLACSSAVPALPFAVAKTFSSSLPVGASDTALVTFTPTQSGEFDDTLTITTNAGTETVALQGVGVAGASILSVDTALRDFGALYVCQSRDTTITLHNTGCDTLTIDSGHVTNGSYATNAVYPIILPPGDSASVQVSLSMNPGNTNGILEFFSNANQGNSSVTIPVTASIIPPAHLVLDLSPSDTSTAGSMVRCYVLLEGTVPAGAISGLTFDITHNDDLLSYQNANGITMTGSAGTAQLQVLQFTGGSQNGSTTGIDTIGSISFRVYLSDSSSTPLTLSNVTFTNALSLADNCVASIVDSGASFTYLFSCGEPLIQDAMLGTLPFTITGIIPNPAQDEITIQLSGAVQPAVEMYDALGRGQDVRSTSLPDGILLDVSNVPSGIYFLRVSSGGYVESRSVVIAH